MWAAIAVFAMSFIEGMSGREEQKAQKRLAKAENLLKKANIDAANRIKDANNELSAAVGSLNRFKQSLGNNQMLKSSGRQQEVIQTNLYRMMADLTEGGVESRLDSSFEMGSLAASASAAGVGGGSRQIMNKTLSLAAAREESARDKQGDQITYDALKSLTNTKADTYTSLDGSLIFDKMDKMPEQYIPKFYKQPDGYGQITANAGMDALSSYIGGGGTFGMGGGGAGKNSGGGGISYGGSGWAGSATGGNSGGGLYNNVSMKV